MTGHSHEHDDFPPIADDRIEVEPDDFDPGPPDEGVDPDTDLDPALRDLALVDDPTAEFVDQDVPDSDEESERRQNR